MEFDKVQFCHINSKEEGVSNPDEGDVRIIKHTGIPVYESLDVPPASSHPLVSGRKFANRKGIPDWHMSVGLLGPDLISIMPRPPQGATSQAKPASDIWPGTPTSGGVLIRAHPVR
jgi:hypothetical protein